MKRTSGHWLLGWSRFVALVATDRPRSSERSYTHTVRISFRSTGRQHMSIPDGGRFVGTYRRSASGRLGAFDNHEARYSPDEP